MRVALKGKSVDAFVQEVWFEGVPAREVWYEGVKLYPDAERSARCLLGACEGCCEQGCGGYAAGADGG